MCCKSSVCLFPDEKQTVLNLVIMFHFPPTLAIKNTKTVHEICDRFSMGHHIVLYRNYRVRIRYVTKTKTKLVSGSRLSKLFPDEKQTVLNLVIMFHFPPTLAIKNTKTVHEICDWSFMAFQISIRSQSKVNHPLFHCLY
jgi:predicted phosphohydrolase